MHSLRVADSETIETLWQRTRNLFWVELSRSTPTWRRLRKLESTDSLLPALGVAHCSVYYWGGASCRFGIFSHNMGTFGTNGLVSASLFIFCQYFEKKLAGNSKISTLPENCLCLVLKFQNRMTHCTWGPAWSRLELGSNGSHVMALHPNICHGHL